MSEARKCDLCGVVHERTVGVISLDVHVATDAETDSGWTDIDFCANCSGRVLAIIRPAMDGFPDTVPEPPKNRQYETMTRLEVGIYHVRVWTTVGHLVAGPDQRIIQAFFEHDWLVLPRRRTVAAQPAPPDIASISAVLDKLDHIAAYEILDQDGHGAIVYPDWK